MRSGICAPRHAPHGSVVGQRRRRTPARTIRAYVRAGLCTDRLFAPGQCGSFPCVGHAGFNLRLVFRSPLRVESGGAAARRRSTTVHSRRAAVDRSQPGACLHAVFCGHATAPRPATATRHGFSAAESFPSDGQLRGPLRSHRAGLQCYGHVFPLPHTRRALRHPTGSPARAPVHTRPRRRV